MLHLWRCRSLVEGVCQPFQMLRKSKRLYISFFVLWELMLESLRFTELWSSRTHLEGLHQRSSCQVMLRTSFLSHYLISSQVTDRRSGNDGAELWRVWTHRSRVPYSTRCCYWRCRSRSRVKRIFTRIRLLLSDGKSERNTT